MRHKPKPSPPSRHSHRLPFSESPNTLVSVRNLSHSYKGRIALRGINLDIREGETFALLGPNGSGKTTLFKIMTTSLLPSSGDVLVGGASVSSDPYEVRQTIGVVFQSIGLDLKLTVWENLISQGHLYGLRGEFLEGRITALLKEFGLSDRAHDRVEMLSGGLQRRAELAKGMLHAPALLFLDEPSTGLDPGARIDFWNFLQKTREEGGTTVVFSTHLIDEADRSQRVAIMDRGSVVAVGTPAALKSEIGGDIILVRSRNPARLVKQIRRVFGIQAASVGDELRIEYPDGHRFIPKLAEALGGNIETITLQKPSLEDVFVRHTGHHLREPNNGGIG